MATLATKDKTGINEECGYFMLVLKCSGYLYHASPVICDMSWRIMVRLSG